jgi:hypothetical protein
MNQMDEMVKIQKKCVKIEEIRKMHKAAKEKSNQVLFIHFFFTSKTFNLYIKITS